MRYKEFRKVLCDEGHRGDEGDFWSPPVLLWLEILGKDDLTEKGDENAQHVARAK